MVVNKLKWLVARTINDLLDVRSLITEIVEYVMETLHEKYDDRIAERGIRKRCENDKSKRI